MYFLEALYVKIRSDIAILILNHASLAAQMPRGMQHPNSILRLRYLSRNKEKKQILQMHYSTQPRMQQLGPPPPNMAPPQLDPAYSTQDLHRFSQNADRFSTNVSAGGAPLAAACLIWLWIRSSFRRHLWLCLYRCQVHAVHFKAH